MPDANLKQLESDKPIHIILGKGNAQTLAEIKMELRILGVRRASTIRAIIAQVCDPDTVAHYGIMDTDTELILTPPAKPQVPDPLDISSGPILLRDTPEEIINKTLDNENAPESDKNE